MMRNQFVTGLGVVGFILLIINYYIWPYPFIQMLGWDLLVLALLLENLNETEGAKSIFQGIIFIFLLMFVVAGIPIAKRFWNSPIENWLLTAISLLVGICSYIIYMWLLLRCFSDVCQFITFLLRKRTINNSIKIDTVSRYPDDLPDND